MLRVAIRQVLIPSLLVSVLGCAHQARSVQALWNPDTIPEAYAHSVAALMWPGLHRSFLVDERGDLCNGLWHVRMELGDSISSASSPRRIAYENRWLPIAHWRRRSGAARWDFEAVAFPARSERDSVLAVSVLAIATNEGSIEAAASLTAVLDTLSLTSPFVAADDQPPALEQLRWLDQTSADSACGTFDERRGGSRASQSVRLHPGESKELRFVVTSHRLPPRELATCARLTHRQRADEVRRYWKETTARGLALDLGDDEAENAWRAAIVVLLGCRELQNGTWMPVGSPFQYRDTWVRDGARLIQALAVGGYTNESRLTARGLLLLQWPQGAFLTQRGQLDGTGQALWAFEQCLLRPAPEPELHEFAESAVRAWRWAEGQRSLGAQSGWPYGNMLPFADPRDNELARAQLVGNDAWMLAGYESAARLCGAAGMASESTSISRSRQAYAQDFLAALDRTHSADVPASWQGVGRDWGNLAAAWPTCALEPGDVRCRNLARRIWATTGGAGLMRYGSSDSLQSYAGSDLGTWALLDDRPAAADSVLSAMLFWRTASGGAAEYFSRSSRDFGSNLPPHPTAAAALVTLMRNALVFDDGDTLRLTLGARERWWRHGRVGRAPTRWGLLDLTFQRTDERAEWHWSAVPVPTLLHLPPHTRAAASSVSPGQLRSHGHEILVPPGATQFVVQLLEEGGAS